MTAPCPSCCAAECRNRPAWQRFAPRVAATVLAIGAYYIVREPLGEEINRILTDGLGRTPEPSTPRVAGMTLLLAVVFFIWKTILLKEKKLYAPALITVILALSDASFGILENHPAPAWLASLTAGTIFEYNPTFVTIGVTLLTELLIGRFFWGKWPNLTSAYITGISAGILIKTSVLWPFLLTGMISITSKYVLRVYGRHLWNPTNFGITMMLFLAPQHVASLSVQAGNSYAAPVVIWLLGGLIMYNLGRFHIPLAFIAAFIPLSFLRAAVTGHPWQTELTPMTSPMFSLYIFFMITDPPTTTRAKWSQVLVAVLVAVMETVCRLAFKDVHSLYHALFTVGPAANAIEIFAGRWRASTARPVEKPLPAIVGQ
jgi:Na+-transporting NADH:ubiquinone oxidoreductase subunit NqrB